MQQAATDEWDELYDRGRFLLRERYRGHTDRIVDEVKFLANQFDQDPQNKAFGNSMEKLFKDLGQDEYGNAKFKKHLVTDITTVILPIVFEEVRYVPIPRIEVSDPAVDVVSAGSICPLPMASLFEVNYIFRSSKILSLRVIT